MINRVSLLSWCRLGRLVLEYRLARDLGVKPLPLRLAWALAGERRAKDRGGI